MKFTNWIVASASACAIVLTACGGGGGGQVGPSGTQEGTSPFAPAPSTLSPPSTTPKAAALDVTVSSVQLPNTPSSKVTVNVVALDSGKRAVPEIPVTVSVDQGSDAVVTQVNTKTDTQGKVTADVSVGSNRANRVVNLVVTSGSIAKTTSLQVVGASITATVTPPVLDPGAPGTVRYRVVDQTSNAMSGQPVQLTAVGLVPPTINAVTDSNGEYVFRYTAPAATGAYTIAATISGATNEQIVNVQPASTVPPASGAIVSASVSANPSVVPINTSGTQNRAEIRALFLGAGNAPIRNVRARFDLNGDGNSIGGSIVSGSTILYSDTNGVATTAYVPAARNSPTDGLTVRVCYGTTDAALANGACPNAAFATLTVINDALGVTIGTDNKIVINAAKLTYIRKYIVQVVDSAGLAKADVNITASVDLPRYLKGSYTPPPVAPPAASGAAPAPAIPWSWIVTAVCVNEDTNRNGVLEAGEDIDGDIRLEPGKSDVAVQLIDTKTGPDGKALIQIEYPQNFATWVSARITVSASGVLGTEGRASFLEDPVGAPADAVKDGQVAPPFVLSPYGLANSCTNPG